MTNKDIKKEKVIAYIGDDQDFFDEMEIRFRQKGVEADYCQKSYYPGSILDISVESLPNVIIFEMPNATTGIISEEIAFLKKVPVFKPIMIIAIFPDRETLERFPTLASCGVNFFYIKGCEYEHLFRDCQLYGLENRIIPPSFAKAKDLKLLKDLNAISTIAVLEADHLYIDTDLGQPWTDSLKLKVNFLNDDQFRDYEVIEHNEFSTIYPMTDRYLLKFPFSGPWDEETNYTLKPEAISDFTENYHLFDAKKGFVWIFSDIKWPEKLFLYSLNCPFHLEHKSLINASNLCDHEWKKPQGIFIELKEDSEEEHELLIELIEKILRTKSYYPIIFILNTQFTSHDLKVRNNYENIISSPKGLEFDFLTKVISTLAKNDEQNKKGLFYFKKEDINRCINLKLESIITSLTEHEIEFELNVEMPLYSLLELKLSETIYITIVEVVDKGESKFAYSGILHGMDELSYQNIRKIVNQLIYNPKNSLTDVEIEKILRSPQAKAEQIIANIEASTKIEEKSETEKGKFDRILPRTNKYLKSKL